MTQLIRSALVPYSAQEMYALVDDVGRYHEFLPWCYWSEVHEDIGTQMRATLVIKKGKIEKSFTTCNTRTPAERIDMSLVEGPFSELQGAWTFQRLDDQACKVGLQLDYEFSSRIIKTAFGAIFSQLANLMVDAFVQRAKDLYGKR